MENSKIQWTHHTFNAWRGCQKVSADCANCYAEDLSLKDSKFGKWSTIRDAGERVVSKESEWGLLNRWNRLAFEAGEVHRVFCSSLSDVFEEYDSEYGKVTQDGSIYRVLSDDGRNMRLGTLNDLRKRLFDRIEQLTNLDFLLLTKRPENVNKMIPAWWRDKLPDNVWIGTSVGYQDVSAKRVAELSKINAKVRFLSCEPLIGPVDLWEHAFVSLKVEHNGDGDTQEIPVRRPVDWVIVGGESGPNARMCSVRWIDDIVRDCKEAGVPVFVKQMGSNCVGANIGWPEGTKMPAIGGRIDLLSKKGGDMNEWPERLRIREFPK